MKSIIVAGNLIVDLLKEIDVFPNPTFLSVIKSFSRSTGGAVPNVSIDLQEMSADLCVRALGLVGEDEDGDFVIGSLRKHGVDVSLIRKLREAKTSFTDVMNEASGRRTFFQCAGANALLSEEDFPLEEIEKASLIHIGYALLLDELDSPDAEFGTKMARLLKTIQDHGTPTSLDMVSDPSSERSKKAVLPALPYCDYLVINETEAQALTDRKILKEDGSTDADEVSFALKALKRLGVKRKVFIHSPEFGAAINEKGDIFFVPSLSLPEGWIVGSTGAGDAFCAGVLYGLLQGWKEERILSYASCSAANNLSSLSASEGAVSEEEIWKLDLLFPRRSN